MGLSETASSSFLSILSDRKLKAGSAWPRPRFLWLPSLLQDFDPVKHRKGGNRKGQWGFCAGSRALPPGSGFMPEAPTHSPSHQGNALGPADPSLQEAGRARGTAAGVEAFRAPACLQRSSPKRTRVILLLLGDKNPWGKPTSPEKGKYAMSQVWAVLAVVQLRGPRFSTTNGTVLVAIFWPTHNLSSWGAPSRPRGLCWPVPCTVSYLWLQVMGATVEASQQVGVSWGSAWTRRGERWVGLC